MEAAGLGEDTGVDVVGLAVGDDTRPDLEAAASTTDRGTTSNESSVESVDATTEEAQDDHSGLTPSPEYIAARDAALAELRAKRELHADPAAPAPIGPDQVAASYEASMHVLDDDEDDDMSDLLAELPVAPAPAPARMPSAAASLPVPNAPARVAQRAASSTPRSRRRAGTSHAARRRAMRRVAPSGRTGELVDVELNAVRLILGIVIVLGGAALMFWYLPTRSPGAVVTTGSYEWRFTEDLYLKARLAAAGIMAVGVFFALLAARFRPRVEVVCKRCHQYVMADRDGVSLKCPRAGHQARFDATTIALIALLVVCGGAVVLFISLGSIVHG